MLIVDDEVDLLNLADKYLTDFGYHTLLAENASQALEMLNKNNRIDLLFSDVVLPGGVNGYELAEQAVELQPQLKILLASGFTAKAIEKSNLEKFAHYLLNKPYRRAELAQRVRMVLDETS